MTKREFVKKIENGSDIMFDVSEYHYVIFTWMEEGVGIGEQNKDTPIMHFETAEELVEQYTIDGIPLAELCGKIVITSYT